MILYQLVFFTPGSKPCNAYFLKQRRHIINNRKYALERPHNLQRLCALTANLGVFFDFSINALRAIQILDYAL
jgi:hypothetical protein